MELTRAQETQLRRTGREAMEKVIAAAQQATQNGIQRATAKVTAVRDVNSVRTVDVDLGSNGYTMPLTGLNYTTDCGNVSVGDMVIVDTNSHKPVVTGVLASRSPATGVTFSRTYSLLNLSGAGKWVKLGWWSGSSDSNSLIIDLYTGNGFNGAVYQNCHARIFVKNGSQTTESQVKAFAGTLQVTAGEGCDASGMAIALPANAHNNCDVYIYFPWQYVNGWMQVSCNGGTWHASVMEANYPTSGYTLQAVGWTAPTVGGLYWRNNLLGGMVGATLWTGSLSKGGSITVSNFNKYRVIAVTISSYAEMMVGINSWSSNYFAASNSMVASSGEPRTIAAAFSKDSISGTKLTLTNSGVRYGASASVSQLNVTGIYGIL